MDKKTLSRTLSISLEEIIEDTKHLNDLHATRIKVKGNLGQIPSKIVVEDGDADLIARYINSGRRNEVVRSTPIFEKEYAQIIENLTKTLDDVSWVA